MSKAAYFPTINFDVDGKIPVYKKIYEGYRLAILSERLRPGARLPSTRDIADELNISRNSVMNAFDQLVAEGYLHATIGSGTYVSDVLPEKMLNVTSRIQQPIRKPRQALEVSVRGSKYVDMRHPSTLPGVTAFRVSLPAIDQFPIETWSRMVARHAQRSSWQLLGYGDPAGYYPLREAIADYLRAARAVHCSPEQVLIVSGSQQALHLCARLLTDPGDAVWLEEPGYFGARAAFSSAGVDIIPIPVDGHGMNPDAIRSPRIPRAIYVTPSHQYPLGITMSVPRRVQLIERAKKMGACIIEDDYDSEYRYLSQPVSALQGLDPSANVIYIGTFSKVLFPALRIGYMVVPADLVALFTNAREENDIFPPTLYQTVLNEFIRDGYFAKHLRRMRSLYRERNQVMTEAIEENLGHLLQIRFSGSGMYLTAHLLKPEDDMRLAELAARARIMVSPLSTHYLTQRKEFGLVLGYGATDARQIRKGIQRLKVAFQAQ